MSNNYSSLNLESSKVSNPIILRESLFSHLKGLVWKDYTGSKSLFWTARLVESEQILFQLRQILQPDAGNPAKNLTKDGIKFATCRQSGSSKTSSYSIQSSFLRRPLVGRLFYGPCRRSSAAGYPPLPGSGLLSFVLAPSRRRPHLSRFGLSVFP